jgi:hypothetical protein
MSVPSAIGTMPQASASAHRVVRIHRRAEDRIERLRAGAELRRVRLADRDRAGRAQPRDERRIFRRHVIAINRRAERRAHAGCRLQVLVRDRQTVQRTHGLPTGQPIVGGPRRLHRPLGGEGDDGVELRIDRFDPRQVRRDDLADGDLPSADQRGDFSRPPLPDIQGLR